MPVAMAACSRRSFKMPPIARGIPSPIVPTTSLGLTRTSLKVTSEWALPSRLTNGSPIRTPGTAASITTTAGPDGSEASPCLTLSTTDIKSELCPEETYDFLPVILRLPPVQLATVGFDGSASVNANDPIFSPRSIGER